MCEGGGRRVDKNPVQFRLQLAVVCESRRIKRDLNLNACEELAFN